MLCKCSYGFVVLQREENQKESFYSLTALYVEKMTRITTQERGMDSYFCTQGPPPSLS